MRFPSEEIQDGIRDRVGALRLLGHGHVPHTLQLFGIMTPFFQLQSGSASFRTDYFSLPDSLSSSATPPCPKFAI